VPVDTLDSPPFPTLQWHHETWTCDLVLPEWAGFQTRRGFYNAVSSPIPSDGTVRLRVEVSGSDRVAPTAEQATAFQYLLEHGRTVRDAILAGVFAQYPQFRVNYLDAFDEDDEEFPEIAAGMPVLDRPDQLARLMGLGNVFLLAVAAGGVAYVGFEFGCEWESGHGLGVLTLRDQIIDIGQAPTAFNGRAAKADAAKG
jgi:hypothetical protein